MKKYPCIMVLDNDQETLRIISRILELEGYDVTAASDGRQALALLGEQKPDLIILNIMLPELDSFQVLNILRQRCGVPMVLLTGWCELTSLAKTLLFGVDGYVRKPFIHKNSPLAIGRN